MYRHRGIAEAAPSASDPDLPDPHPSGPGTRLSAALLLPVMACLLIPPGLVVHGALADTGGGTPSSSVVPDTISDAVAATAAEFRVDESGAATYSIPVYTLPGTAGVGPQISLNYSSQGGYGPLGKGWSIGGLSTISRCRATREAGDFISGGVPVDGDPLPITYTSEDRYCLDGQRLLVPSDGAMCDVAVSGMSLQTWRTEIESFQRVCAYTPTATPAHGPAFFTVEREDGSISWYGDRNHNSPANRPDAYIQTNAPGHTAVAQVWAQTRFQDSTGNFFNYVYDENPGSPGAAEFVLKEVRYTGKNVLPGQSGSAKTPYARLIFNYVELPSTQWALGYSAQGATHTQRQRLVSITSCAANEPVCAVANQVRHYVLGYETTNPSHSGLARLASVQECRNDTGSSVCAAPTTFEWSAGKYEFATLEKPAAYTTNASSLVSFKMADIDGDGRLDMVYLRGPVAGCSNSSVVVGLARLNGSGQPVFQGWSSSCLSANIASRGDGAWHLFDYDGDGRDDLFVSAGTGLGWRVHPSSGTAFNVATNLISGLSPAIVSQSDPLSQVHIADLNGDGLIDIVYPASGVLRARLMERQGSGGFAWGTERTVSIDMDSFPPIAPGCDDPFDFFVKNCDRTVTGIPTPKTNFTQLADFNGDAASDLLFRVTTTADYWNYTCPIPRPPPPEDDDRSPQPSRLSSAFDPSASQAEREKASASAQGEPAFTPPACWDTETTDLLHALVVTEPGSTIVLADYGAVAYGNPEAIVFADINGDGLTDVLRRNAGSDWFVSINQGNLFGLGGALGIGTYREQTRFVDVNGDGRADIVYLTTVGTNKVYYVRHALPGGGFAATGVPLPGGGSNARLCEGSSCNPADYVPMFADLDGDGNLDFLSLRIQNNPTTIVSRATHRYAPRDTITKITNGFGAATELTYAPLTLKDLYRRDANSRDTTNWGRGSPVTDLVAPMYAVWRAASSSPQAGAPNALATLYYRYMGAKVQAGGRGFLGFRVAFTFDPNQGSGQVITRTAYRQDFPFTGMPLNTLRQVLTTPYAVPACLSGTVTDACFTTPGDLFPALGGSQLSLSTHTWESDTDITAVNTPFAPGVQRPVQVRTAATEETLRDPFTAVDTGKVNTSFTYGPYGDVTGTSVETRTGAGTLVSTVTTANTYASNAARWRLKRIVGSTVTHARPGQPSVVRNVSFAYAMGGPVTGLLTEERTQPGGGNALDLRTLYELDAYGNRTRTTLCAAVADCAPGALVFQPSSQQSVHRTSRVVYDSAGRYPVETWELFRTSSSHVEVKTSQIVERDLFGNVTRAYDINGLDSFAVYGTLGRAYYAWTETVPGSTPGDPTKGVESKVTYRWCGTGSGQVSCPTGAKVRQQTEATASPMQWSYLDVLGRPMLQVTQGFNAGVSGKDATAICTAYDAAGRPKQVSAPFFLPGTVGTSPTLAANTCTASGLAWTTTTYDLLGRPTQVVAPKDVSGTLTVSTAYSGLTTTTTNPRGNATTQTRNALGELVSVVDANGTAMTYAYFADGTVQRVRRNVGRGNIDNTFSYDVPGRKTQQIDPDSGTTTFQYNAAGELLAQVDAAGNRIESWYDARGRVWKKTVRRANNTIESESLYAWDTATNGRGQLAGESISGTYTAWTGQPGTALDFGRTYTYDSLGRPLGSSTSVDGISYATAVQYDTLGRPWKAQDASTRWAKTQYTARGFAVATCESTLADAITTCPANNTTYLRTQETDVWGNVVNERRGHSAAMDVTRTFGANTGQPKTICAGNASTCNLMQEAYAWDNNGNMSTRTKENRYQENFQYDQLDRLTHADMVTQNGVSLPTPVVLHRAQYDGLGNICAKQIGSTSVGFTYAGRAGCGVTTPNGGGSTSTTGPHRVTTVGSRSYTYDARGNQLTRDMPGTASDRTIAYSLDDKAHQIDLGGNQTRYWYGSDGQRYKRTQGGKTLLYLGSVEIEIDGSVSTIRRTVAGVMIQTIVGSVVTNHYQFLDVLGSLVRTTNASGTVIDSLDYKSFGLRVSYTNPETITYAGSSLSIRGFTGHEQPDVVDMDVIHMNGRIYDPELGRFLQPDPMIQAPGNLQSWNAYTYVFNNPLTLVDPTGMFSVSRLLKMVVAIVITYYTGGWGASLWASQSYAAAIFVVAGGGYASGYVQSGSGKGGLAGAYSALAFFGVGRLGAKYSWGKSQQVVAHAMAGGIVAELQGGKFGHGFYSAGLSKAVMINLPSTGKDWSDTAINAVAGGTISAATGGKFANGALTAAMQFSLNQMLSNRATKWTPSGVKRILGRTEEGRRFLSELKDSGVEINRFDVARDAYVNPDGTINSVVDYDGSGGEFVAGNYDKDLGLIRLFSGQDNMSAALSLYHEYQHHLGYDEVDARIRTEQFAIENKLRQSAPGYRTKQNTVNVEFIRGQLAPGGAFHSHYNPGLKRIRTYPRGDQDAGFF